MQKYKTNASIIGIVMANGWDEEGRVIEIKISAPGENDYIVTSDEKSGALMMMLNKRVNVRGDIFVDDVERLFVKIKSFRIKERR
jgi:hypothetical protein